MDLTTNYLGLKLKNPLVPSASPLSRNLDNIKQMEDAGAAAIVMESLFEEQIEHEKKEVVSFDETKPLFIEFCSGSGAWICEKAGKDPSANWVAVEKKFDRARKIWKRGKELGNIFVLCSRAEEFCEEYVPRQKVERIFVNFPDPWPKRKHIKNRLLSAQFFTSVQKITKKGSKLTLATDAAFYADWAIEEAKKSGLWEVEERSKNLEEYGSSYFKELWEKKGRTIHYVTFRLHPS